MIMLRKTFKYISIGLLLCFMPGCATLYNPATGRKEFIFIDTQTEVSIGQNVANEITKKHRLVTDREINIRVQELGRRIASVSDRKDIEYRFYVLADKELNAVSLPGGFIYLNSGIIEVLNNEELAFVIGHEVGHLSARHAVKNIQANMAYQLIYSVAFAGIGNKTAGNPQDIAKAIDTIYNLIELGYSREDEYESDKLGVKYAFKAGFNPYASIPALKKIKKEESSEIKVLGYLRTHPYIDDRINALQKNIPLLTGKPNER